MTEPAGAMFYLLAPALWWTPCGDGNALACGVGFPMRVIRMPRWAAAADRQMPCGIDGRHTVAMASAVSSDGASTGDV